LSSQQNNHADYHYNKYENAQTNGYIAKEHSISLLLIKYGMIFEFDPASVNFFEFCHADIRGSACFCFDCICTLPHLFKPLRFGLCTLAGYHLSEDSEWLSTGRAGFQTDGVQCLAGGTLQLTLLDASMAVFTE
jgi:hypothetical protein